MASCHQGGCIHFVEKTKEEGLLFFSEATLRLLCSLLLYLTDPWAIFARSLCRSTDLFIKKPLLVSTVLKLLTIQIKVCYFRLFSTIRCGLWGRGKSIICLSDQAPFFDCESVTKGLSSILSLEMDSLSPQHKEQPLKDGTLN